MKPGNLFIQGAKSGGKRKMRIRYGTRRIFGVCSFFVNSACVRERNQKLWKKDCLPLNV